MVLASEDVLKSSLTANLRGPHARNVLAQGVDPCEMKAALGKNAFFLRMREWEIAQTPGWSALVGTVKPPRQGNSLLPATG